MKFTFRKIEALVVLSTAAVLVSLYPFERANSGHSRTSARVPDVLPARENASRTPARPPIAGIVHERANSALSPARAPVSDVADLPAARFNSNRPPTHILHPDAPGQCFSDLRVNYSAPCAACVHFVTVANVAHKWASWQFLARSVGAVASTLRASQKCFTLHVYTNARKSSEFWRALIEAGGDETRILPYPTDMPRNGYSGKDARLEMSRHKLDLMERDETQFGKRSIWTDLDTIVVADMSCVYARAPNFFVTILDYSRPLKGMDGVWFDVHPMRTTFGDLFMADSRFTESVRKLERDGFPTPKGDVQDYANLFVHRCDGSVLDLRALVRREGFVKGGPMAFGWDCFGRVLFGSERGRRIKDGRLECRMRYAGEVGWFPAATLTFNSYAFRRFLDEPRRYFHTRELWEWARKRGIVRVNATEALNSTREGKAVRKR